MHEVKRNLNLFINIRNNITQASTILSEQHSYFIDSSFLTLLFSLSKSLSTSQLFYYSDSILTVSFFATLSFYFYLYFYRVVVSVAFDKRLLIDRDFRINSEDANDIHALSSTWKFSWFFHHFLRLAKRFIKIWK